jgi:DNA polymerase-3 subunit gamma/tau
MNQCDINYRQSSNKRLLVELTLIEIAQITQPDEGPASGRKPRRLKSLFKHLVSQSQPKKAAPQVAAAAAATSKESQSANISISIGSAGSVNTSGPANTSGTASTSGSADAAGPTTPAGKPRPQLKSSISFSWNNLRKSNEQRKMHIIPGTLGENDPNVTSQDEHQEFSQQDLELQWMSMCNRMPQHLSGIATRMKNMNPSITTFPAVEVVVDNQIALEQMEVIKGSIVNTLKLHLHNNDITLTMRVAKQEEKGRILSRREQYELMEKENPSIAKLRELLSLELA